MDELRHQRQHNAIDPQHEKLVEEVVEVVQIISQKHLGDNLRDQRCVNVDELVVLVNSLSVFF